MRIAVARYFAGAASVYSFPWSETICTSVVVFATLGLIEMKRLATWPPSKTQDTVSPPKTVATFSSAGSKMRVDCSRPARMSGGVSVSLMTTVRGALGKRVCGASGDVAAWLVVTAPTARPELIKQD